MMKGLMAILAVLVVALGISFGMAWLVTWAVATILGATVTLPYVVAVWIILLVLGHFTGGTRIEVNR